MKTRCFTIASVLYIVCFTALCGLAAFAFDIIIMPNSFKIIASTVAVLSGFFASYFCALGYGGQRKGGEVMRTYLFLLFVFYLIMLIDFTLIDDSFGRNIFNVLDWDKEALTDYVHRSTNIIPFYTVRLFIKGYFNDKLTLTATVVNLLGNLVALMPIPFFVKLFFEKCNTALRMLAVVLLSSVAIELLQFLFLTGACDIDDVILNTSGAMWFYFIGKKEKISRGISKLTFGVWNTNETEA